MCFESLLVAAPHPWSCDYAVVIQSGRKGRNWVDSRKAREIHKPSKSSIFLLFLANARSRVVLRRRERDFTLSLSTLFNINRYFAAKHCRHAFVMQKSLQKHRTAHDQHPGSTFCHRHPPARKSMGNGDGFQPLTDETAASGRATLSWEISRLNLSIRLTSPEQDPGGCDREPQSYLSRAASAQIGPPNTPRAPDGQGARPAILTAISAQTSNLCIYPYATS